MRVDEAIEAGAAALADGRWEDARAAFESALEHGEPPEALDGLAKVRYREGDYAAAIELRERAYAGFRARGELRHPARLAAYHLAFDYVAVHGNFAAASGWLERGRRLAEAAGDCPERGWVELAGVLATDDPGERDRHLAAATEIARRFGDADLEFDALAYSGVTMVESGHIREGMRRLDEAAAAAQGGEVRSHTAAGEIYCKMLVACEMTLDVQRAQQWTDAANALGRRSHVGWASAICRMYYGGILTAAGRWDEAERELATSVRIYDATYRALRAGAVVRLADLRVRQGRFEEAQQLLAGHEHDSASVRPSAALRFARGEVDVAAALLRRHVDRHGDGVLAAPLLSLLAQAEVAAGRFDPARIISGRLAALARENPVPFLSAFSAFTAGIAGPDEEAAGHLEAAVADFAAAGLPLEEARSRLALALLLSSRSSGRPDGAGPTQARGRVGVAIAEAEAALRIFDRLGAGPDADAAAALLRTLGSRARTGPKRVGVLSQREQQVLHLLGLGLSNPEIATRLYISRKTAAHHVSNVLAKLGLRNRAEAAAFAHTADRSSGRASPGGGASE